MFDPLSFSPKHHFCDFELNSGRLLYDRNRELWSARYAAIHFHDLYLMASLVIDVMWTTTKEKAAIQATNSTSTRIVQKISMSMPKVLARLFLS